MNLYLIKRGPMPNVHKAPYHGVIICTRVDIAKWEAGSTADRAWVWEKYDTAPGGGWGLRVWDGLQLVYNYAGNIGWDHTQQDGKYRFPDGSRPSLMAHSRSEEPWTLLAGAVWFSTAKMPDWIKEMGVIYPHDRFTQDTIVNHSCNGLGKYLMNPKREKRPDFWPEGTETA